jgi:hypothetical protein
MERATVKIKCKMCRLTALLGLLAMVQGLAWSQMQNACAVSGDATVSAVDVQQSINMALGLSSCTTNIDGAGVCNVVVVQRVINAALGEGCVTNHWVSLSWTASTSSNVAGYNVYRGTASTGPFTKMNSSPINSISAVDNTVVPGQTYYYVATAVDTSGNESAYSSPSPAAVVPSP